MRSHTVKLGTRGSPLALCQAGLVTEELRRRWPDLDVTIVPIKTSGDKFLDVVLSQVGGKGLFVKEIEEALLDGRIDLAVHSLKDLPAELAPGLCEGAVMRREDPLDALVARNGLRFTDLPRGARIGTSSLRRQVQFLHCRPDLQIESLRGNVQTRLNKLETLGLEAVVLAAAGLIRLGLQDRITERLQPDLCLPAIGQGALVIEIREDDRQTAERVETLNHRETRQATTAERAFLRRLGGSCVTPIAAFGRLEGETLELTGMVAGLDGKRLLRQAVVGEAGAPEQVGQTLADRLLSAGAGEIIREVNAQLSEKRG
ncbi:MAG: hydroxymethylbilane synthase [Candidatus Methylomirabilis oxygeniifera]|uniref:Porphobilinogen deaminase n=1 Tax=Methylomirabilis oxygeniifera TaxID=671143 RepID=D5MN38_METO1|nr:MAG: hydroxymethylbilane synthase [Candidatus Methylomirabilis oxyfera]CBE68140.1 Porphobilinogen deaminase (PBG) (Hydroxymethylbilane synthase) (HMBS) (Pre-uroporphyrinogen synthase) [Candidatus Methylomirabilis oxyfera]